MTALLVVCALCVEFQAVGHSWAKRAEPAQPDAATQGDRSQAIREIQRLASKAQQLYGEGKYQDAVAVTQRALAVSEQAMGPEHPDTATSLNNLGFLYKAMGQYKQALPLYQRALAIREQVLGPKHPDTATSLNNLAALHRGMGQFEQALPLLQRALTIREKVQGPEHPDTAASLSNLALLYQSMGQYEQALPLYQRALAIRQKALVLEHPDTAPLLNNLAGLYEAMGQYDRALPLYQQALFIREKVLGPEHPNTAKSLNNLAGLYRAMGQDEQALPFYQRALVITEQVLGPEHPDTATCLNNLAALHRAMGQYKQALPLHQRALAIREKVLGPEHPDMATSLNNLAGLYHTIGLPERALPLFQRAFRILSRADAPADFALVAGNLGVIYREQEQLGPAIFYYKLAVNAAQRLRAGAKGLEVELQHSLTKTVEESYRALAALLIREGRLVEAEQVLAMLKEQEQFEFVRRDPVSDPRHTQATLSTTEQALADRLGENARTLATIYTELEAFEKRKGRDAEDEHAREQVRERLAVASERFDGLLKEVEQQLTAQTKGDRAKELATLSTSVGTVRDVLSALHDTTGARPAVVYFLPSEQATTFLVITKDGSFAIHGGLGEKQLNERVGALREAIARRDASYRQHAQQLYEALITPIEPQLKAVQVDMLMLYLTDALRYLPFAALYDATDHTHLVEKYSLGLYTAAAQANLKEQPTLTWSAAALGLSKSQPGFEALPSVVQELRGIVRDAKTRSPGGVMDGSRYLDELFTRQEFMRLLEGDGHYPVLHVATHFKLAPGNEADSFLVLGNGENLTLSQIRTDQGIKLRGYDLVTLSACETAVGGGSRGLEVEGLGVTIQNKGAKAVLATLWKVQDAGTARLMEEFYRARGETRKGTKAEALRQAQLSLLQGRVKADKGNIDFRHPYYWAPFVLMGNWK